MVWTAFNDAAVSSLCYLVSMRHRLTNEDLKCRIRDRYAVDPQTGCWNWLAGISTSGYGYCTVTQFKEEYAHRVSYRAFKGDIPTTMCVCHTCDNKRCVNPDHLFLGTILDNVRDMIAKGYVHRSPKTILSESDAEAIFRLRKWGISRKAIAKRFGVCKSTVDHIFYGTRWPQVKQRFDRPAS